MEDKLTMEWHPIDVTAVVPKATEEQAKAWLAENMSRLRDALVQDGYETLCVCAAEHVKYWLPDEPAVKYDDVENCIHQSMKARKGVTPVARSLGPVFYAAYLDTEDTGERYDIATFDTEEEARAALLEMEREWALAHAPRKPVSPHARMFDHEELSILLEIAMFGFEQHRDKVDINDEVMDELREKLYRYLNLDEPA